MTQSNSITTVACPCCKKPVRWIGEEKFKPFCSERCKLIDLGDWATEAHKIPGPILIDPEVEDEPPFFN